MAQEYFASGKAPTQQKDHRREINPKDQFGRKWGMTIEIRTGDPTGSCTPCGFTDHLRNSANYLRTAKTEDGQVDLSRVIVDFPTWTMHVEDDERGWYEQLHRNAMQVYKKGSLSPEDVRALDSDGFLLDLTGPKPFPSSKVLKAAARGDKQFLGLEPLDRAHREALCLPTMDDMQATQQEQLTKGATASLPPDEYTAFVKWAFANDPKMTMTAVGKLWAEHKANLQAA